MYDAKLLVGGVDVSARHDAAYERVSPVTDEAVTVAAAASVSDAIQSVNTAAAAFPAWSETSPETRRALLNRAAETLTSKAELFIEAMTLETGATGDWGAFNVKLAGDILRDAAAMTTHVTSQILPSDTPGVTALAWRQPAGVCLGIAPWNAPVILGVRAIAMPLACANTVLFKTSELCPKTHRLIGDVMREAGLPDGVVNVIPNAPADAHAVVEALIAHPAVRRVSFTGSTRVGRLVAETAARHLKKCLLELGGKAPLIVLDDADIDEAVRAAAFGAFMNQGQICMSTERIIVVDSVADEFVAAFAQKSRQMLAGDPREARLPLGTMISKEAARRIEALIADAVEKGATLVVGTPARGTILDGAVVDYVTPAMRLYREECFGPIAAIIRVGSVDEAVTIANDCEYGLAAAVFSRDVGKALAVARRIESGICHINGATVDDQPQMPFGGMKSSGYGRFGGIAAIDEFTELRWITISGEPRDYPL